MLSPLEIPSSSAVPIFTCTGKIALLAVNYSRHRKSLVKFPPLFYFDLGWCKQQLYIIPACFYKDYQLIISPLSCRSQSKLMQYII